MIVDGWFGRILILVRDQQLSDSVTDAFSTTKSIHRNSNAIKDRCRSFHMQAGKPMIRLQLITMSGLLALLLVTEPRAAAQRQDEPLFAVSIRNAMLEQRFVRTRTEEEPVVTNILNSDVQGQQSTTTETRIRIVPDATQLRFDLISTGCVKSQTTGFNRQAVIDSTGQHQFEITKPFWFDGTRFLTRPGHGTIKATQAPQRVVSAVGANMPLLRPLSDRLAWEQVNRRQAEINQAVAKDVSRTVLPKIDRIVDSEFAQLGRQLTQLQTQLKSYLPTMPYTWTAQSTETAFSIAAIPQQSKQRTGEFAITATEFPTLATDEEIVFSVSESLTTGFLEHFVPAGTVLTDSQIESAATEWNQAGDERWSAAALSQVYLQLQRNAAAEPKMFSLQLAKVQPIAIRFDRGFICIDTSFQIVPKIGVPSGWMKVTWRLRGKGLANDQWAVTLTDVNVTDLEASIPIGRRQQSQVRVAQQELRIPVESTFVPDEAPGELFVPDDDSNIDQSDADNNERSENGTVESGTVWMTIVRNATQSIQKKAAPLVLPKEFDTPNTVAGSPGLRMVRIEAVNGVLRTAFRTVDRPASPQIQIPTDSSRGQK